MPYVPLTFAPGEAYQFDWSHEIVVMDGVTTTVKVAHVRLCHSRMMLVRAYPRDGAGTPPDRHCDDASPWLDLPRNEDVRHGGQRLLIKHGAKADKYR